MREIKFRIWRKNANSMLSWEEDRICIIAHLNYPTSSWELMQYTGLKDINGKEIYEGDIIRHKEFGISQVIWFAETGFGLAKSINMYTKTSDHLGAMLPMEMAEVIGNIYKNRELLEDK